MKIEQIYTGCLAQGTYYITSGDEAAIIDPLRETKPYMDRLEQDGVELKYIFETHFHADFVSGHVDLSRKTNAPIVYGPGADCTFNCIAAEDNQVFRLGDVSIKVLHTPGHTLESACFLLIDEEGVERALFSGDTLFLGDVGRPDLAQKAAHMSQEALAGLLYDSLYSKIMPLPNGVVIYPAHGAGSACGKNMMQEKQDTLGNQKKMNYALNQPDKAAFVAAVTDGLLPPPAYFGANVAMNKEGYDDFDDVLQRGRVALDSAEFERLWRTGDVLVLDTRDAADFGRAFIPGSVNVGLNGDFAPWVGALVADVRQPLLLVADAGKAEEVITRLSRVGFDNVLGYLDGGFPAWDAAGNETDKVQQITAEQFAAEAAARKVKVIDVRKRTEYAAGHLCGADNRPLAAINTWMGDIDAIPHFFLHCAGGYRSMIAAGILQARGYRNFTEVIGGFNAIAKTGAIDLQGSCSVRSES